MTNGKLNFTAYHGTNEHGLRLLTRGKYALPKTDCNTGDLGKGLYGFINNRQLALEWALKNNKVSQSSKVVELKIECDADDCLDLDDPENLRMFLQCKELFRNAVTKRLLQSIDRGETRRYCIDGFVIESMLRKTKANPSVIVKKTFTQTSKDIFKINGRQVPLISNFANGKEMCVRLQNPVYTRECK